MGFRKPLIDDFLKMKAAYLTAHHTQKKDLKKKIEQLKADIASFGGHKADVGFDWAVEFAEVFINGGFDIGIANPPYVRMELFKDITPLKFQSICKTKGFIQCKKELTSSDPCSCIEHFVVYVIVNIFCEISLDHVSRNFVDGNFKI